MTKKQSTVFLGKVQVLYRVAIPPEVRQLEDVQIGDILELTVRNVTTSREVKK